MLMQTHPLLLTPVSLRRTMRRGDDLANDDVLASQSALYCVNLLGLPAVVVPVELADGLPSAVQLIGWRFREQACLDAAREIESRGPEFRRILWESILKPAPSNGARS
jgi:amidase